MSGDRTGTGGGAGGCLHTRKDTGSPRNSRVEPSLLGLILMGSDWFLEDPKGTQSPLDLGLGPGCERRVPRPPGPPPPAPAAEQTWEASSRMRPCFSLGPSSWVTLRGPSRPARGLALAPRADQSPEPQLLPFRPAGSRGQLSAPALPALPALGSLGSFLTLSVLPSSSSGE